MSAARRQEPGPRPKRSRCPAAAAMSLHVIPAIEEEFDKPAFTNMSAEVWNDLVRPKIIPPVQGWGRLLARRAEKDRLLIRVRCVASWRDLSSTFRRATKTRVFPRDVTRRRR